MPRAGANLVRRSISSLASAGDASYTAGPDEHATRRQTPLRYGDVLSLLLLWFEPYQRFRRIPQCQSDCKGSAGIRVRTDRDCRNLEVRPGPLSLLVR